MKRRGSQARREKRGWEYMSGEGKGGRGDFNRPKDRKKRGKVSNWWKGPNSREWVEYKRKRKKKVPGPYLEGGSSS